MIRIPPNSYSLYAANQCIAAVIFNIALVPGEAVMTVVIPRKEGHHYDDNTQDFLSEYGICI
jgi:hypothetical protein